MSLLALPVEGGAQVFSRVRQQTELGFEVKGTSRQTVGSKRQDVDLRQWVTLPFRGNLIHPRIFSYDVALRPLFTQQFSATTDVPLRSQQLGWDASLRLLSSAPVAVTVSTNRASGSSVGALDSRGEFSVANLTASAKIAVPYLPMQFAYADRSAENLWFSGVNDTPVARSDRTKSLRFSASNSKLELVVERLGFEDRIGGRDFQLDRANLRHQFRWGKGSRLQTMLDRGNRQGTGEYLRRAWQESLHIQHAVGTSSDLYVRRFGTVTPQGTSGEQSFGMRVNSRVSDWLAIGARGDSRATRYNGNQEKVLSLSPEFNVSLDLPLGALLRFGGTFGFERRSLDRVDGGTIQVLNEEHRVEESRSFTLEQAGADPETVVIRSDDEVFEYLQDLDYLLLKVDQRIEVVIPLESRIQVGETVLASYRFTPLDVPEGDLYIGQGSASLRLWRLAVSHSQSLRRRRGGGDGLESRIEHGAATAILGTLDAMTTTVSASLPTPVGAWHLAATRRTQESSSFDFESFEGETSLTLPPLRRLQIRLGAAARGTQDVGGWVSSRSAYTSFQWQLFRRTRLQGRVQAWEMDLRDSQRERSLGGDLNLNFQLGATETWIRYRFTLRSEPTPFKVHGLQLRIVRRF